jgi:nucleobase:cation symporter-1, NCS1 family
MAGAVEQESLGGASPCADSDELRVFEGPRPTRPGDLVLEGQGMAPIPEEHRYGAVYRMFTVWFTPNMELSGVFTGTLAVVFGLGFGLGLLAIVIGTVIGSLPVAILCTWGPRTGTAQVPLARLPFGKTIVLTGSVQWLSAVAWDALCGLFGAQAAQLLFHVPFWLGAVTVLALEGVISVFGYEFVHRLQEWGAAILIVLFVVLSVKIFSHHVVLPHDTVHGAAMAGAFVLMVAISISQGISWASYASDYSRYMKPATSKAAVFAYTMAGLTVSYVWVEGIGLAGASVLRDHTAAGVRTLMGGGFLGVLALIAMVFSVVASNSLNDYSGSLAFQALGARVRRPVIAAAVAILAFTPILYLNAGNTSGRFENLLLFTSYWVAPFCAIVMIDWYYNRSRYTPSFLCGALRFARLGNGWPAIVSFCVGFGVMVPFMNTSIIVGPVAHALKGADTAFYVGFVVAGVLYYVLRRVAIRQEAGRAPGLVSAAADGRGQSRTGPTGPTAPTGREQVLPIWMNASWSTRSSGTPTPTAPRRCHRRSAGFPACSGRRGSWPRSSPT